MCIQTIDVAKVVMISPVTIINVANSVVNLQPYFETNGAANMPVKNM